MPQPQILPDQISGAGTPASAGITAGNATMSAGQVNINTSAVLSTSVILLSVQALSGTAGTLRAASITDGVSFSILSSSASDNSTVSWSIMN